MRDRPFRRRWSLQLWLLVPFGLLLVFAVLAISVVGELGARREADDLVQQRGETVLAGINERLAERRRSKEVFALLLAGDERLIDAVSRRDPTDIARILVPRQAELNLGRISVYDNDSQLLLFLGVQQEGVDVRPEIAAALSGVSGSRSSTAEDGLAVLATAPIKGAAGITGAIVVGSTLNGATLQEVQYREGVVLAVFRAGRLVSTTAEEGELGVLLTSTGASSNSAGGLQSQIEDLEYHASSMALSDTDTLLAFIPTHDVAAEAVQRRNALLLTALTLITFLVLIGVLMARRISGPLTSMTRAAAGLVRGDYHARISASSIRELDSLGTTVNYLAGELEQRMAELSENEAKLTHLANHDALTNLYNRRRFSETLALQIAQSLRYGTEGAVLFMDLDGFKYVNDSLGHRAGDELLARTASVLTREVREIDVVGRLGGDEFAVLLARADLDEAESLASRLLHALEQQHFSLSGEPVRVTGSIGIALFPLHGSTAEDVLAHADIAMYEAKTAGRNRFACYLPGTVITQPLARLNWETRIREALDEDRFVLYAQLIEGLNKNKPHYELLIRMIDHDGAVVEPQAFIDVAERSDLILRIDRWVVAQAIDLVAKRVHIGAPVCVGVNLSGRSIVEKSLLAYIEETVSHAGVDPASLVFEVTETAAISDLAAARAFIQGLRAFGCKVALDDFGVGFASFAYLKHLPVDYLKLDGSFIEHLAADVLDQHLVKAMVQVAKALGKETIAEFVSDAESVDLLRDYGVDYAQGYHIGLPAPVSEVLGVSPSWSSRSRAGRNAA